MSSARLLAVLGPLMACVAILALAPLALAQSPATPTTVTFVQRSAVHQLRPCLPVLTAADHHLIAVQFGIGGAPIPTIAAVAAQLKESPSAEYAELVHALRKMESAHHRGQCPVDDPLPAPSTAAAGAQVAPASSGSGSAGAASSAPAGAIVATPAPAVASSSSHHAMILAVLIVLLALAGAVTFLMRRASLSPAGEGMVGGRLSRQAPRPRRYVGRATLMVLTPVLRHSLTRDAYVLRAVGGRVGPVLREDRRRHSLPIEGNDRRTSGVA